MRIGSLFTGYGGLDMAVQSVLGGELAWVSDIEPAACVLLANHHPGVPNLGDVTTVSWSQVARDHGPIDVLTAGYPCQPFSNAGLRKGTNDDRHLWPDVRRAIRFLRPSLVVLENVRDHLTMGFDVVLADLADLGMSARWGTVRASDAGAPHQRARLFVVAYPTRGTGGAGPGRRLPEPSRTAGLAAHHVAAAADSLGERHDGGREQGATATAFGWRPDAPRLADVAADTSSVRSDPLGTHSNPEAGADGGADGNDQLPIDWDKYEPAIRRWEGVMGRPAPAPVIDGPKRLTLNPVFVEWLMGLPAGWVTGHGLKPSQELKLCGNGVVPRQAEMALTLLGVAS